MRVKKYRNTALKMQRIAALRVCSAYRTVSTQAALVIAGLTPIDLLVKERLDKWQLQLGKTKARNFSYQAWQEDWDNIEQGRWTHTLIPQIKPWVERKHGDVNFHLTQFLSGHGSFGSYLHRIGKVASHGCVHCGHFDTPEHAVFGCERWKTQKQNLEERIGKEIKPTNVISIILQSIEHWGEVERYIVRILKEREKLEKEREQNNAS